MQLPGKDGRVDRGEMIDGAGQPAAGQCRRWSVRESSSARNASGTFGDVLGFLREFALAIESLVSPMPCHEFIR